ncbi:MAG: DUF4395 family protein [Burkholderiaceae bacterium]
MLRFDVPPVHANAARLDALVTFLICLLAFGLELPWLMAITAVTGFVRGFFSHARCPLHKASLRLLQRFDAAGAKENAGAKMFAAKLLFIASAVSLVLWLAGSTLWKVPVGVLLVFSFAEWAFKFCAGCWAYTLWFQMRGQ